MLNKYDNLIDFFILLLKCFFILLLFGVYLPIIIEYILIHYISQTNLHNNSIFVYNILNANKNILYKYYYYFKCFIK